MSFVPKFRFSLREDAGTYYKVVGGVVSTSATKVSLTGGVEQWDETGVDFERNGVLHGVFTTYNEGLLFSGDGAKIIRYVNYNNSIEKTLQIEVEISRNSDKTYIPYFIGDLALGTFKDVTDKGARKVSVSIKKGGFNAVFTAARSIKRAIPIASPNSVDVYTNGFEIYNLWEWRTFADPADATLVTANSTVLAGQPIGWRMTIPAAQVYMDGDIGFGSNNGYVKETFLQLTGSAIGGGASDRMEQFVVQASRSGHLQFGIKQAINYQNTNAGTGHYRFRLLVLIADNNYDPPTEHIIYSDPLTLAPGNNRNLTIDIVSSFIAIAEGQKAFIAYNVEFEAGSGTFTGPVDGFMAWQGGGSYNIQARFKVAPTTTKGLRYAVAVQQLLNMTPGGTFTLSSTLLTNSALSPATNYDNVPYDNVLTSGDALRQLNTAAGYPELSLSLEDVLRDMFGTEGAGIGISGDNLIIEKLSHFYDKNTEICNLGEVTEWQGEWAEDLFVNEFELGAEEQTFDKLNGRYEINTGQVSTLPYPTQVKNKGEWRTPINWAIYPQEIARANISEKKTADSKSDNETFGLVTSGLGTPLILYRPAGQNLATGVPNPSSIYNVPKTPARNKGRLLPYLQSLCYGRDGEVIAFQTADKNKEYISNLGAGTIVEKADISLPSGVDPLFVPYYHNFLCKVPENFYALMAANPYGYISFTVFGIPFKGFVWKCSQRAGHSLAQQFKLLAHPDTNILLLQ